MILLIHCDKEPAQVLIDGRTFSIPPNEPWEVPEIRGTDTNNNGPQQYITPPRQVANLILQHAWYHGLIECEVVQKGKGNYTVDIEASMKRAKDKLLEAENQLLRKYVEDQQQRVLGGSPALPPGGRVAKIVKDRGINLKKEFNIDPPGYALDKMADRDQEVADVRKDNETLREQMLKMQQQMASLLAKDEADTGKKDKKEK